MGQLLFMQFCALSKAKGMEIIMKHINESFIEDTINRMAKNKTVYGCVLCVENSDSTISWIRGTGNIQAGDKYFLTSVSKLCTSLLIMRLKSENRVHLDDKVCKYLPGSLLDGLHVLNGKDYTHDITIKHLLSHTSGIPDYLSYKNPNGKTTDSNLNEGIDEPLNLEKILNSVRKLEPTFKPGQKEKVAYSNTNYRLLGVLIENVTGQKIGDVFQDYIFNDLGLKHTYPYKDTSTINPVPMYYKSKELHIPQCMATITAEGGIVSTAKESMAILKAFFSGQYFPVEDLEELKDWNFIFFPFQCYFGVGLEKLWVPRIKSIVKPIKEIVGFWGSSGAFAFFNPDTDLYFTGTVNQSSGLAHGAVYNALISIIKKQL